MTKEGSLRELHDNINTRGSGNDKKLVWASLPYKNPKRLPNCTFTQTDVHFAAWRVAGDRRRMFAQITTGANMAEAQVFE